jgi:hypothetical protein
LLADRFAHTRQGPESRGSRTSEKRRRLDQGWTWPRKYRAVSIMPKFATHHAQDRADRCCMLISGPWASYRVPLPAPRRHAFHHLLGTVKPIQVVGQLASPHLTLAPLSDLQFEDTIWLPAPLLTYVLTQSCEQHGRRSGATRHTWLTQFRRCTLRHQTGILESSDQVEALRADRSWSVRVTVYQHLKCLLFHLRVK